MRSLKLTLNLFVMVVNAIDGIVVDDYIGFDLFVGGKNDRHFIGWLMKLELVVWLSIESSMRINVK